jgi:hypothetical protein
MKKVSIPMPAKTAPATAEDWVQGPRSQHERSRPDAPSEPMKRFTIDVPLELHTRIKTQCAMRGQKMADVLRELLEREFPQS